MQQKQVSYEECKHNTERINIAFHSCPCGSIRYFPFQSVSGLVGLYQWEGRAANVKEALELIVKEYSGNLERYNNNKELVEVARERLSREFKQ